MLSHTEAILTRIANCSDLGPTPFVNFIATIFANNNNNNNNNNNSSCVTCSLVYNDTDIMLTVLSS